MYSASSEEDEMLKLNFNIYTSVGEGYHSTMESGETSYESSVDPDLKRRYKRFSSNTELSGSSEEHRMLKTNYDVNTSVEKNKWCSSPGEMSRESTIDSHLNLKNVVDVSSVKVEETDSNNTEFSPWMSQEETQEAISVDETMDDGHHRCNICLYNAKCKCDLTRHTFCHRDPINPDTFKCPFCEYKNNERDHNFETHLLSHHNLPSKQKCSICDYVCNSVYDLNGHLFLHKDTSHIDFFKCSLCKYETKILLNFMSHMRVHEKLKCSLCNIEFLNKNGLANHILKHKDLNNLNWFKCNFCNYKSKYMGSFRLHYNTHKDSFEELTCFICNHKCEAKVDLEKHMRLHKDPENFDLYKCYLCDKKTEKLEDLIMHLLTHLSVINQSYCVCLGTYEPPKKKMRKSENYKETTQKQKCFRCPQCDAKYKTEYSLKKHMLDHDDSSAMYNCDHCDYKSKYKELMQKHKKRHQVAKCNFCDLKMSKLDHREHNRIFHSDNTNNPNTVFKCCMCNWNSETRGELARHLLSHKNADNTCKICNRRIKREMTWISHMLMHSNAHISKTHKCDQCPYFTTSLKYLQGHKETHKDRSKRKLFQCPDCKSEYTTKVSLRLHMQDHADKAVIEKLLLYCDQCDFKTKYRCSMKNHKLTHQLVTCTFCNLTMNGLDFKQHNETLHSNSLEQTKNILECCMCVYKCETKSDMEKHVLDHKDINNICNICGFKNDTEVSWVSHMLTHSNDNLKKRHKCDQCVYSTMFFKKLQLHKEKHKERNLLKCAHCNTKFTTKWSLKMHMKNHADSSKVVTYNCDDCGYKTKDKYIYNKHRLRHERSCSFCDMKIIASDLKEHNEIFHSDGLNDSNALLKCCICSCKCETKSGLAEHLLLHKDSKNTCSLCQCVFKKNISWLSHMLIHSNFDSTKCHMQWCNQCNYFTTNLKNMERHKEKHENDPEHTLFKCEGCDTKYATKHSLDLHIQDNMDQGDSEQSCDKCDYKTKFRCGMTNHKLGHKLMMCKSCNLTMSGLDLKEHNEMVHSGSSNYISNVWKCSVCDFTSDSKSDLGKHLVIHKKSASNVCDICSYENKNDSSWVSHMLLHSDVNVPKIYKCDQCAYCTANLPNLQRHKQTHKDRSKRNLFNCTHCDAKFTTKSSLKYHSHCHADAFYHCDKCDYKSKYEQNLTKHKLIHQLEKCSVCNLEMNESELVTHNKTFHLDVASDSMNEFKCCICPYKCKLRGDLAKHLLLHKDSKNTCIICDYKLKKEVSWLSHMLIHSNVTLRKSYKCDECSYCTTIKATFDRHKDTHKDRSERDLLECPHCDTKLTTKMSLKVHILARHMDSSEVRTYNDYKTKYKSKLGNRELKHEELKCSFCHVDMQNQSDLEKHTERSHPEHLKVFGILKCGICDNKCETKEDLAKHFLRHKDPTSYSVFKCGTCEFKTRYLNNLKLHKKHDGCLEGDGAAESRVTWEGTWYRCDECDYKCKFKCSLKKHILKHQLVTCSVCNLEMSELDLEAHDTIFHSQVGSDSIDEFKCCICPYKCKIRDDLAKHFLLHKDPTSYSVFKCGTCEYKTRYLNNLKLHKKHDSCLEGGHAAESRVPLEGTLYRCDECDYKSKFKRMLKKHKLKHQLGRCSVCNLEMSELDLVVHNQIFHEEVSSDSTNEFKCCICSYKCKIRGDLAKHLLLHKDSKNTCGICGYTIKKEVSWLSHMFIHSNANLRNSYKCDQCSYCTTIKTNLERHIDTHKDFSERNLFECSHCQAKLATKMSLKLHIQTRHSYPSEVKTYDYNTKYKSKLGNYELKHEELKCSFCHVNIENRSELEKHIERSHPEHLKVFGILHKTQGSCLEGDGAAESRVTWEGTWYRCDECDYKCKFKCSLKKHILKHQLKTCSVCNLEMNELDLEAHNTIFHSQVGSDSIDEFKCCICPYKCKIRDDLAKHLLLHKDPKNTCSICGFKLKKEVSWISHMFIHSNINLKNSYKCDQCPYCTTNKRNMERHKDTHKDRSERNLFECPYCDAKLTVKKSLKFHIQTRHSNSSEVRTYNKYKTKENSELGKRKLKQEDVKCSFCHVNIENQSELEKHIKRSHPERPKVLGILQCGICDNKCQTKEDLAKHFLLHKDPTSCSFFKCDTCEYKTRYLNDLKLHKKHGSCLERVHATGSRVPSEVVLYRCDKCDYKSKFEHLFARHKIRHRLARCSVCDLEMSEVDLEEHNKIIHSEISSDSTNEFKCCICLYKCQTPGDLVKHLLLHKDPKNTCIICGYKLKKIVSWISHMFIHSNANLSNSYRCDQCPYCTTNKTNLERHKDRHKDLSERDLLECPHCPAKVTTKSSLKLHMQVHLDFSEAITYNCDYCDFKTKYKATYTKHKLRHGRCNFCYVNIENQSELEKHIERSHPEHKKHGSCLEGGHAAESRAPLEGALYPCDKCDYKSKFKYMLKKHQLKHNLGKCSVCSLEMNQLDLEAHYKIFHVEVSSDSINEFKCCVCSYKCETRGDLAKHLLLHKDPKNTCNICGCLIRKEVSWICHMFIHSNVNLKKSFKCDQCPYCTTTKKNLERHKDRHKDRSERNLLECPHCDAKLTTKASLKLHIQSHMDPTEVITYNCDHCDYKTKYKSKLGPHNLKYHADESGGPLGGALYHCDECDYQCKFEPMLKKHKLIHQSGSSEVDLEAHNKISRSEVNNDSINEFKCDECNYKSRFEHILKKHKLKHQMGTCSVCNLEMSEWDLRSHNKTCHSKASNDSINEFKCCVCLSKCETRGDLAKHLLRHNDPKNICNICGYTLKKEVSWISHMLIHSNVTVRKSYYCDRCSYCTTVKNNFLRHKATHKDLSERNILECPHCHAKLASKTSLKVHMQNHLDASKVVTYNCDHCDYKTNYRLKLRKHKLKHEGVKCSICHLKIKNQSELKKHIGSSHPERLKVFSIVHCGICDNRCETKEGLAKHFLLHKDPTSYGIFKCDTCNYKSRYLNDLKLHKKHGSCLECGDGTENVIQDNKVKLFQCEEYPFHSVFVPQIDKHLRKRKRSEEETTHCNETKLSKTIKIVSHDKEKSKSPNVLVKNKHPKLLYTYKCCICCRKFCFTTKDKLSRHLLFHKDPKNPRNFKCKLCSYTARHLAHFKLHFHPHKPVKSNTTTEAITTAEADTLKCDICPFEASEHYKLKRHKETHKDPSERQFFTCVHCDSKYQFKSSLTKHIKKRHSGT